MTKHVAILYGGLSAERDVSLESGRACADALKELGFRVSEIDAGRDVARKIEEAAPDAVFNALHGRWGEDGCVQGILETLNIPYTHSGVLASALAMNKPMAKKLFADAGLPVAEHFRVSAAELFEDRDPLPWPYVVKPAGEGSSVGVVIVRNGERISPDNPGPWQEHDDLMIERFIPGRELTVAVMGERALDVLELRPKRGFYDYEAKYTEGIVEHLLPAPVPPEIAQQANTIALTAHATLGCRGVTRADFRYDDTQGETGELILLEINTQPGMTKLSLVPEIAASAGFGFTELVGWIMEDASCPR